VKVFISSVIRGLEKERDAADRAARALDHTVIRSEQFGAMASSAQRACRREARESDVVILLVGATYGTKDPQSKKSPTHEEFEEAQKTNRDVLVFVQEGVQRDADQEAFLREVRDWSSGALTGRFRDGDDLRDAVTTALGRLERSRSAGPVDARDLEARLDAATTAERRGSGDPTLHVAVVGAPRQTVLSASQLDDAGLQRDLERDALYSDVAVLPRETETRTRASGGAIVIGQDRARVTIDASGSITVVTPAKRPRERGEFMFDLVEDDIREGIARAITYALTTLDRVVDPHERVSDLAIAAALRDVGYAGWTTRAAAERNPNRSSGVSLRGHEVISARAEPLTRKRAVARAQADAIARDLTAILRRAATE
jgi:hypothetical protein